MKTRTLLLLLVVGLGLVLFGCSSDETVEPSPTEPTAVEAETSEPVAEESTEPAEAVADESVAPAGPDEDEKTDTEAQDADVKDKPQAASSGSEG